MDGSVEDVGLALRTFGVFDYLVFVLMLLICAGIGIYFGFFAKQDTAQDYLMGGRNMKTFPVSMSLISSFISGITLLGTPTEMYLYGTQYLFIGVAMVLTGVVMATAFLPVFHGLHLTSTYEYLQRRFDKRVRLFGSFLFSIAIITWVPIVIYVPALAFNQVTGVNVHIITPIVCVVCIFYTCVGGLKAVVWTDVIQTFFMFGAMIIVIVKGTIEVGGLGVVWQRNSDSGRIEAPSFELDMVQRHTVWSLMIGGFFMWLSFNGTSQSQLQRYLALSSMKEARKAVIIFAVGVLTIIYMCAYSGLLIYATYHDCDPLTTKLAKAKDQLLPLLVMDVLGGLPGMPGMFVAGVFSAALSSMSTGLNSMAAVVLEDFYKGFFQRPLSERQTDILMKTVVVVLGVICVALVFVVEKLGTGVLQVSMSLGGITNGVTLGIFIMGLFLPWVTATAALVGGTAGLAFMSWVCLGTQAVIASGDLTFPTKPVTVEGCTYNFTQPTMSTSVVRSSEVFPLYRMSYLWYTLLGSLICVAVALVTSFLLGPNDITCADHKLFSPVIRRFLPKTKSEHADAEMTLLNGYKVAEVELAHKSHEKKNLPLT